MSSVFIGFDGFIDHLYHAVKERDGRKAYVPYSTLKEFGSVIEHTSGKSCNIESYLLSTSLGGNAPLIALGLSSLGTPSHLVGCLGRPTLHPVFRALEEQGVSCTSIGNPGITSAFEFYDGKLMLGSMNDVLQVTLEECFERYPTIVKAIDEATFLVTANWTMSPLVLEFWHWLDKLPPEQLQNKHLFVDFADPRKRSQKELKEALSILMNLSKKMTCSISMNEREAEAVLSALSLETRLSLEDKLKALSNALPLINLYMHTSRKVLGCSSSLQSEIFDVPLIQTPKRLTGAGDMFNAGVLSALFENCGLRHQLLRGMASSGIWIRKGSPATHDEAHAFEELYSHSMDSYENFQTFFDNISMRE